MHYDKKLFLFAYVDDYKMAGRAENIGPMWAAMKAAGLDLEPSVPLSKNVYLGCGQMDVEPGPALISQKLECFQLGQPSCSHQRRQTGRASCHNAHKDIPKMVSVHSQVR